MAFGRRQFAALSRHRRNSSRCKAVRPPRRRLPRGGSLNVQPTRRSDDRLVHKGTAQRGETHIIRVSVQSTPTFQPKHGPLRPRFSPRLLFVARLEPRAEDRKSTRLNSSHTVISYAVFCLK